MICVAKIATLAPKDFFVAGSTPFSVGVAAYGDEAVKVSISILRNGQTVASSRPTMALDYGLRVPADSYNLRADLTPGDYVVSMSASSAGAATQESAELKVFDAAAATILVTDQTTFDAAIATIKAASYSHGRIILADGYYTYPSGVNYDLSTTDKLISFESRTSGVQFTGIAPNIKWAYWYRCRFSNSSGTAFNAKADSHHFFEKCAFISAKTALIAVADSYVRVEDCHMSAVSSGMISARIVRGLSWSYLDGVVFQNCQVIDGTTGYRGVVAGSDTVAGKKKAIWCLFDGVSTGVVIRNNVLVDDYSSILRTGQSFSKAIIVGNSFTTSGASPIVIAMMTGSFLAHNTVYHTGTGSSIAVTGNTSGNFVANCWFQTLDSSIRRLSDSGVWKNNASTSDISVGVNCLVSVDPKFQNSYRFIGVSSPLRGTGISLSSVRTVQGIQASNQIGALPYHKDVGLASIYRAVLFDPSFSYVSPAVVVL